ncbi:MAG: 30S ribosomal protein S6 [Minisyncoccia bacterium]
MEKQIEEKMDVMTVYELSYILLPSLAESEIPAKVGSLKDLITQAGGAIVSFEDPVLIDLAYPMTRVTPTTRVKVGGGYFGWIKFELSGEEVGKIKNKLDSDGEVVRFLLIKTVKENTLVNGKMNLAREEKQRKEEEVLEEVGVIPEEIAKEVSTEEVDKSIDELVVE